MKTLRTIFGTLIASLLLTEPAAATVNVSKANGYVAISPPPSLYVSKTNAYVAVSPPASLYISKVITYVVVGQNQPSTFIMTKNENSCLGANASVLNNLCALLKQAWYSIAKR